MFKIRWKKKGQPTKPADPTKSVVRGVLVAAVMHRLWQEQLVQCATAVPAQRAVLTPLIEAALTPSLSFLIEHARTHGLITDEEAADLIAGRVRAVEGFKEVV